jgi:glycosyltransferase involved in cell wall biosynthesis
MKIAHVGNTAGVASTIANEQHKRGHNVDVFVFDDITQNQFGGMRINCNSQFKRWSFFRNLRNYDVWHYHYPYGSLKKSLEERCGQKVFLKHYHGDDLRGKHEDNFCMVSTPDLLKYAPNGTWVPNPIDFDVISKIKNDASEGKVLKIAHYPYYQLMNSYEDPYSEALNDLESQNLCKVVRVMGVPHNTALQMMTDCDVVLGKIIPTMGWFSKFELEGMALGKPVIAYVSDELYEKYRPPIYHTTKTTFKEDLKALLADESERRRLATEGRKYVSKNHDVQKIVDTIMKLYTLTSNTV